MCQKNVTHRINNLLRQVSQMSTVYQSPDELSHVSVKSSFPQSSDFTSPLCQQTSPCTMANGNDYAYKIPSHQYVLLGRQYELLGPSPYHEFPGCLDELPAVSMSSSRTRMWRNSSPATAAAQMSVSRSPTPSPRSLMSRRVPAPPPPGSRRCAKTTPTP